MESSDGRFVIIFNGEIYNFRKLRDDLKTFGHCFKSKSDTEVVLAAFLQWGVLSAVPRFLGMFAMAVWDKEGKKLFLIRDRLGKKPLYYGWQGGHFIFGSELKALRRHPGFLGAINRDALTNYLQFLYVPGPESIYAGIHKLEPGSILTLDFAQGITAPRSYVNRYWDPKDAAQYGQANLFQGDDQLAISTLENLLLDAVQMRMIADVPLGALLSGGIDSSLIVSLMQAQSSQPVRTFTIGFHESHFNEAPYAKKVASHLGTFHTDLYVDSRQAQEVIPLLPSIYDEPFADSSQIPTYLVSALARNDVTVVLSGDGGDELFGGYNRYRIAKRSWSCLRHVPLQLRKALSALILSVSPGRWNHCLEILPRAFSGKGLDSLTGDRIHKFTKILEATSIDNLYAALTSFWLEPQELLLNCIRARNILNSPERWAKNLDETHRMMFIDLISYLIDDILVKVDRATMHVSLEARAPFLDHRVAELAWCFPLDIKIRNREGKWILREILKKYIPLSLLNRPKMGFGIPLDQWLRTTLRPWAEDLLSVNALSKDGFFEPKIIRQKWQEHISGSRNWQYHLWGILMFQQWKRSQAPISDTLIASPVKVKLS